MMTISANAARMVDGVNYDVDRDNLTATVVALDNYTNYTGDIVIPSKLTIGSYTFTVVSIGQGAFSGSDITSISLPNTIVDIQTAAFGSCRRLKELSLPDGVKTIGESAFQGCESITKLKLPDNDVMLGSRAFCRLNSLQELTIPDSWTQIGNEKASEVFWSCTSLKKLTVGKKVETIWNSAFSGCTSLSEIICPADGSLTYIAQGAFSNCHSITSMKFIPPTVKKIGYYAFDHCKGLEEIFIPKTVEVLYCSGNWETSTTKLVIEDGSTPLVQIGGRSIIYASEVYLGRPIDAELSDGVPFYNTYLTKLSLGPMFTGNNEWNFGKKLKEIYSYVTDPSVINCMFDENVYDNATLYVPKGTKAAYMAKYNFAPFFDIQEMAGGKPEVGKVFNLSVGNNELAFKVTDNNSMEVEVSFANRNKVSGEVTIPEHIEYEGYTFTVTSIGYGTKDGLGYSHCPHLTSIVIPNSVKSIGEYAFLGSSLTTVTIPNNVLSIGKCAFVSESLCSINVSSDNHNYTSVNGVLFSKDMKTIICYPAGKTESSYSIPNCVTTIGESSFEHCKNLIMLTIPNSLMIIGDYAFNYCNSIKKISIPNSVTSIGVGAFQACENLTDVTISNNITSISDYLFYYCRSLCSVIIPESVTSIGEYSFYNTGLTSVTIPNNVTSIGNFAFFDCEDLVSVSLGRNVTRMGIAFGFCDRLSSVYISDLEAWCKYNYGQSFQLVFYHLFLNGKEIKELVIPNSITEIPNDAFIGCIGLTSVIIPNSVKSVRFESFRYCSGLTSVIIGTGFQICYKMAFADCPNLMNVYCYANRIQGYIDTFENSQIGKATLHVHEPSMNYYENTSPWSGFGNIVALKEGDPSGIEAIKNGEQANDNSPVYNLNGQRVNAPAKGVYIKNGRKVLVK